MKSLLLALLTVFSAQAFANSSDSGVLTCELSELKNGETLTYEIQIQSTDNTHGDIQLFQLQLHPEFSGLIAVVKNVAVLHLYNNDGYIFTTHADLSGTGAVFYQILIPSENTTHFNGVQISCTL